MTAYAERATEELSELKASLEREHAAFKAQGLALNMARGKPSKAQLDLSMPLLETLTTLEA